MKNESGRSLIEMLGVLAVGALAAAGAVRAYQSVRTRQQRILAEEDLKNIVENTRIIYGGRKNYAGISKSYLTKVGVLKIDRIMGREFRISAPEDGARFRIIFDDIDLGDCAHFATRRFDWAAVVVNGIETEPASRCMELSPNKLEFVSE